MDHVYYESTKNSSSASLANGATFTGGYEDILHYQEIGLFLYASQQTTLYVDFSVDGLTTHRTLTYVVSAATGTGHRLARVARYFRVRLANASGSTTTVALQTILGSDPKTALTSAGTINDYSDAQLTKAIIVGKKPDGSTYDAVKISDDNKLEIALLKTVFGETLVAEKRPIINISGVYGTPERLTETYTSGTGSTAGAYDNSPGRELRVQSGTDVGGYGVIRSKKAMTYRAGIGLEGLFTAKFTTPVASSIQRAGLFNIGNELTCGYDGTQFGFLHRSGGRPEIRILTVSAAATGAETVTVTLNSVAMTVSVTNASAAQNAYEIATGRTWTGWTAYNMDNKVIFQASTVGAKSGTYSATSTGTLTGSIAQAMAGLAVTDNWIYQSSWNKTTLSSSSDPFILNPLKGNIYKVEFQYLGYGPLKFLVENPNTGFLTLAHEIQYPNANTRPNIDIPVFKMGIIAASAGSTSNLTVTTGSMAGFRQSGIDVPAKIHSYTNSKTGIGATLTNVLAVKKTTYGNGMLMISDVILQYLSVAVEGTKPAQIEVRLNPTFSAATLWESIDEDSSLVGTNTGSTVSGGELIFSFGLGKSSDRSFPLRDLDLILSNDDVLSIAVKTASGTTDVVASIVWADEQ